MCTAKCPCPAGEGDEIKNIYEGLSAEVLAEKGRTEAFVFNAGSEGVFNTFTDCYSKDIEGKEDSLG